MGHLGGGEVPRQWDFPRSSIIYMTTASSRIHLRPLGLHRNREDGRKGRFNTYEGGVAVRRYLRQTWQQSHVRWKRQQGFLGREQETCLIFCLRSEYVFGWSTQGFPRLLRFFLVSGVCQGSGLGFGSY